MPWAVPLGELRRGQVYSHILFLVGQMAVPQGVNPHDFCLGTPAELTAELQLPPTGMPQNRS